MWAKSSATGQPTRPAQPFILSRSIICNRMSTTLLGVVPSGECLRGEGLVWLIGAAVCLLAATTGPMFVSAAMDGHICAAVPLAIASQVPLPNL